ncbi:hypothetical protein WJX75_001495 [Coccomyxa subellipsoidea]|uniref:non-specific serine/threonine protein kinase n=1 Tax=Coccomyxa subellipsoidea TaxID=248742 RepID=A0ABR2YT79_9CHLO
MQASSSRVKMTINQRIVEKNRIPVGSSEQQPLTPRGRGGTSGQVPIGPGWSSARAHSQAASTSTEPGGHGELAITVLRASGLEQQISGMRKATSKVHGFVAKAALLRSSPYSTPLPAFSDTRPTYSRDAQDDEASLYEDPSGNSFVLQLRTPSRMAAGKLAGTGTSQLANATGASFTKEAKYAATTPEEQRSAVIEREAEAVLRTWTEDDDAGGCKDAEMGSLTGWQALADQVMAEMEEDEAAEEQQDAKEPDEGVSPTVLMQAAGLMSTMNPVVGTSEITSEDASYKPSTELQPGGTFFVQYEVRKELGEGAFGRVVKVRRRRDGRMFVAKIMHDRGMTDKARVEAQNEVAVLASLDHPNVVKYYECFAERGNQVKIVMELCEDGDLDGFLKAQGGRHLSEEEIMHKFVQICLSVHYVHSKGLIHRDLKTCNLLLDSGIVKLGDFGISKVISAQQNAAQTMVGTPYYMSPEIFKGKGYGPKTDVWALGCILYEMCCLRKAFEAPNLGAITIKIMSGKYAPIPGQYSNDMRLLETVFPCPLADSLSALGG